MRVLVVEDEVRLAATLQDLLELNGYTVDVCHDGEAGLDNALTSIYDVILLDVMLPKLDGFTVLRRLRAEGSTTPVLMLTARSELTDRVNGLDSGADYYLTKPFEPKELLACIRALTRRQPELRQTDALKYGDLRLEKTSFTLSLRRALRAAQPEGVRHDGDADAEPEAGHHQGEAAAEGLGAMSPTQRTTMWRSTSPSCGRSWTISTPR